MNVLHKLHKIKQSFDARIQPLTQQQVVQVLNQSAMRKHERSITSHVSPVKYQPSSHIVSKLNKIQQFGLTRSKQFQFVFGQVWTQYQKDNEYILKLGEFENTLNQVMRDITHQDLKPIAEEVMEDYHKEDIDFAVNKVRQYRNKLNNIKKMVFDKNESIRKLLLKKQNLEKYFQQLKKVEAKVTPIYKTLYSEHEIKIISEHVKGQHSQLKKYKFYSTLSSFLNDRIYEFEKSLRKIFIDNLLKMDQEEVKEIQTFLTNLKLFKKQTVPELLIFCFKHALNLEIRSLLSQQNPDQIEDVGSILQKIEPEMCMKCFCQLLLKCQSLLNNFQIIKTMFGIQYSFPQIQSYSKQALILFYQSFKNVFCQPKSSQIFLFSVIHHFCVYILKDEDIWCVIARQTAQQVKFRLIQYKNSVVEDLNVELWNAVDFQYTTRLPTYQNILILDLTYHGKIEWMLNKTLFNKIHSSSVPNSHILYSFFKFSKTFEKMCLNIPYFDPLDSNFLVSCALELLNHFAIEILRMFVDYPPVACTLYEKHRQWFNYKATYYLLKAKQPKKELRIIEDEDKVSLFCESIKFIDDLVRGHEWVLLYKHYQLTEINIEKVRDMENVLSQLPSLAHRCFIKSKLKSINLDIVGNNQWISGSDSNFEQLVDSFDMDSIVAKQSKIQYSLQFEYLFIDKICSQNMKTHNFEKMIEQFSVIKRKLESKGYKSSKEVQKFLVVCIGKEEDQILKLLYEKKFVYSLRTIQFLYGLIKNKNSEKHGFWEVLTSICEGEPTQY